MEKNIDKDMKILVAAFAYNEIKYLPFMVDYYRKQECDLLILDNYSTDGTYEWLISNGINTVRINTNESFHLGILQKALNERIAEIKPDWVLYCGIDLYYFFDKPIKDIILAADVLGFNLISVRHYDAYNTGEKFAVPLHENYFYFREYEKSLKMIGKLSDGFKLFADEIIVSNPRIYESDGFLVNYGMCKTKEEREETFTRRRKAWEMGMCNRWGAHYKPASEVQWLWSRNGLIDIRQTEDYEIMKKNLS